MTKYRRKLIEVALPLDAINAASAREKSIRHGHPSTLHLWWARRPLAAVRAVLFAQLVDDPSSLPEEFPTEEEQDAERQRLFAIIEELVKWENSTNEEVLDAARAEILRSTDGNPPPILDPFAGGGSIPLEAQRLGLEARASDLNPVAVLINKALIEILPRWADMPPVHPDAEQRTHWKGAEGLAEDVRLYGKWMRDEAEKRIGHLYPKAALEDGSEATAIAWIWARTVTCPNPACGATMPLAATFWLGKKKGKEAWINPIVDTDTKTVTFEIGHGLQGPPDPPKVGRGAKFRCLVCGEIAPENHVKAEGRAGRMSAQLMAVVAKGQRRRDYTAPSGVTVSPSLDAATETDPGLDIPLSSNSRHTAPPLYGMATQRQLYTDRQIISLSTFASLVPAIRHIACDDASPTERDHSEYADALAVFLSMQVAKLADLNSSLVPWKVDAECPVHVFSQQVYPMVWDYAEVNPFSGASGSWESVGLNLRRGMESVAPRAGQVGAASQADAHDAVVGSKAALNTDPPYYDNVPYADLSDYFYVWLRLSLGKILDQTFVTLSAPKEPEIVADPVRHGSRSTADEHFEEGFKNVFRSARASVGYEPMILYYAFRQTEKRIEGQVSAGWSSMLEGLLDAGWAVTGTWPLRTEGKSRMRSIGSNALASSIVLACRPREESAGLTDRQGFMRALRAELPLALHALQKAHIAPVDLRQAAVGPGMATFSRYSRVVEPDGKRMSVRTALGLINQALDQVLGEQEAAFDPETRWAIQWFSQYFEDEGPYGVAESLATAMATAVDSMVESGILDSGRGKVRLLSRDEYPDNWDPIRDKRKPVWETCQHLVRRLEEQGEAAAGELLSQLGGLGESAQLLAYRLYTICEQSRPNLAGPYNALVTAWPEIQQHAATSLSVNPTQQSFDE